MAKTKELNLTGKGVSPIRITSVDRLAENYIRERDKRLTQTPKEVAAKLKLIEALHSNREQIQQPDGTIVYRYDETVITLTPGKEKLKVESASVDEPE